MLIITIYQEGMWEKMSQCFLDVIISYLAVTGLFCFGWMFEEVHIYFLSFPVTNNQFQFFIDLKIKFLFIMN